MDQRKKAICILIIGLVFIIVTVVGVCVCVNLILNTSITDLENGTSYESNEDVIKYKHIISYSPLSVTEQFYEYKYYIDLENKGITQEWKEYWLNLKDIRRNGKSTKKIDEDVSEKLLNIFKNIDSKDVVHNENIWPMKTGLTDIKVDSSKKEVWYYFNDFKEYKELENILNNVFSQE